MSSLHGSIQNVSKDLSGLLSVRECHEISVMAPPQILVQNQRFDLKIGGLYGPGLYLVGPIKGSYWDMSRDMINPGWVT